MQFRQSDFAKSNCVKYKFETSSSEESYFDKTDLQDLKKKKHVKGIGKYNLKNTS